MSHCGASSDIERSNHGQKTTGQKSTENANPGQKTTRKKGHPDKRPPRWFFSGEILSHLTMCFYFIVLDSG